MELFVRYYANPSTREFRKGIRGIELLGQRESVSRFQVFLSIKTSCLNKSNASLYGTGQEN